MSYKVLLWDIDGTLLDFLASEANAIRTCFELHDLGECSDEMLADYSAINVRYWEMLERGEMSKPEILVGRFKEFFEKYGIDTSMAEAFNSDYQFHLGDKIFFVEGAPQIVRDFKSMGIRQYGVTNGTKVAQERKLSRSGLSELLDGTFISEDVGAEKPSTEYFDAVAAGIGIGGERTFEPSEVLLIGDSLTSDIRGANNAGIPCCWYDPSEKSDPYDLRIDYKIRKLDELRMIVR